MRKKLPAFQCELLIRLSPQKLSEFCSEFVRLMATSRTSRNQKEKASRKDAKTQRTRKAFLCGTFAALRLCVKVFAFFATLELVRDYAICQLR